MNQSELIHAVSERLEGDKRAADRAVRAVIAEIREAVSKGEKVAIVGFGTFERRVRPARSARNPSNGTVVDVPARAVVKFNPGAAFTTAARDNHAAGN